MSFSWIALFKKCLRVNRNKAPQARTLLQGPPVFKKRFINISWLRDEILPMCRWFYVWTTRFQNYAKSIEELKLELVHQQTNLNRLKISVEQAQVAMHEALQQNTPDLALPPRLLPDSVPPILPAISRDRSRNCRMFTCFDHSRQVLHIHSQLTP